MGRQSKDNEYLHTPSGRGKSKKKQAKKNVSPEGTSADIASPPALTTKTDEESVYDFLNEYGASTPYRIAGALKMDRPLVSKILRKLQKQGKINLNLS